MIKVYMHCDDVLHTELVAALLPPFSSLDRSHPASQDNQSLPPREYNLIIVDLDLPDWKNRLLSINNAQCPPPVIILSPRDNLKSIIWSIRNGAYDWIAKPVNPRDLARVISEAVQRHDMVQESFDDPNFSNLIGHSSAISEVKRLAVRFAVSDKPILLTGESGTGKGIIARAIHSLSPRQNGAYRFRNCGALAPTLIESELFGTMQGAYTGAVDRAGDFELTRNGTFFLDEIGELAIESQAKLLKVLEEGAFYRLGGTRQLSTNSRIIAATNRNLEEMVRVGTFREDLYYRIKILPIWIPPLRQRKEDIPLLCSFFLKQINKQLSYPALDRLMEYQWPGNVRQLSACLSRAELVCEGTKIESTDLIF